MTDREFVMLMLVLTPISMLMGAIACECFVSLRDWWKGRR